MITDDEREHLDKVRAADGDFYAELLALTLLRLQGIDPIHTETVIVTTIIEANRDITARIYSSNT